MNRKKRTYWLAVMAIALLLGCTPRGDTNATTSTAAATAADSTLIPNPFRASDFSYDENGFLTCSAGKYIHGIDVSVHQGRIRWQEVAQADIRFAMIRLGHRSVGQGIVRADKRWEENYAGARAAGLQVGAYFYSQAVSVEEAVQEAQFVLQVLDGRALDLPVVFDWEIYSETGRTAQVDAATVTACARAFCQIIEQGGYQPMVYFNNDIGIRLLDLEQMQAAGYPFWYARYYHDMQWPYRVDMWQYCESGTVPGIDEPVDLDLLFDYT